MRNRLSDLRIPRSDALPLSYRDSTLRKGMVSFELGKEIEKDVFRLVISCRYHLLLQFPVFKI